MTLARGNLAYKNQNRIPVTEALLIDIFRMIFIAFKVYKKFTLRAYDFHVFQTPYCSCTAQVKYDQVK